MGKIIFGRAFGLSILSALSLMAVFAVSAQAVEFQINSKPALSATLTGAQEGGDHLIVEGRKLDIECQKADVNATSEIKNPKEGLVIITLLECKAFKFEGGEKLQELKECTIDNFTTTSVLLPTEHNGVKYVLVEQDEGQLFTTYFTLGLLCPLPEENPVKGTHGGEITATTNGTAVNLVVSSKITQSLLGDKLFFGVFQGYVESQLTLELTGAHKGLKFGVA